MKQCVGMLIMLIALTQAAAAANPAEIKSASPTSRDMIDLYEQAKAAAPVAQAKTAALQFPIPVLDTKSGYSKIMLNGKEYWVRNSQVRMQRTSSAKCGPTSIIALGPTTSTPGVSEHACPKGR